MTLCHPTARLAREVRGFLRERLGQRVPLRAVAHRHNVPIGQVVEAVHRLRDAGEEVRLHRDGSNTVTLLST